MNRLLCLALCVAAAFGARSPPSGKKYGNAGALISEMYCKLDPKVNASMLPSGKLLLDLFCEKSADGQLQRKQGYYNFFEDECNKNRGIFLNKQANGSYDGHTYDCGNLPLTWPTVDGVNNTLEKQVCENDFASTEDRLALMDTYIQAEWDATITEDQDTCDFGTFGLLHCPTVGPGGRDAPVWKNTKQFPWSDKIKGAPIRAANVGGVFVLEPWITPGFTAWNNEVRDQYTFSQTPGAEKALNDHWNNFYGPEDFKQMKAYNLNTIRLPVGWWYFASADEAKPYIIPTQSLSEADHPITKMIKMANDAGLMVLLDLHGAPGSQNGFDNSGVKSLDPVVEEWGETWLYDPDMIQKTIDINKKIAAYIKTLKGMGLDNILALEILNEPFVFLDMSRVRDFYYDCIEAIREDNPDLPIFIHDAFRHIEWQWLLKDFPHENVFFDTHLYHAFNKADIASDTPHLDALKQLAHEDISCRYGALLRWKSCTGLPAFTGEWSLAIDDCVGYIRSSVIGNSSQLESYGQCDNLLGRFSNSTGKPGDKGYVNSTWWDEHIKSFAMRQISMFEREIGWAFWTYKLDAKGQEDPSAVLWSFDLAVKKGYIDTDFPTDACDRIPDYTGYENTKGKDPGPSDISEAIWQRHVTPNKNIDFGKYKSFRAM